MWLLDFASDKHELEESAARSGFKDFLIFIASFSGTNSCKHEKERNMVPAYNSFLFAFLFFWFYVHKRKRKTAGRKELLVVVPPTKIPTRHVELPHSEKPFDMLTHYFSSVVEIQASFHPRPHARPQGARLSRQQTRPAKPERQFRQRAQLRL